MRFTEYDYQDEHGVDGVAAMDGVWDAHWRGREGLKEDLSDEPLWATIRDELDRPGRLLEAGCGTGQWVQFLGTLGHDVVGVDYAASGLEVGRAHNANLELVQADFRQLPFDDETFDYIVSFGAVEHDVNGPEGALQEFRRVLRPDGKLMCSVPCLNLYRKLALPLLVAQRWLKCRKTVRRLWGKTAPFAFHQYVWSPEEYTAVLARCGFRVRHVRGYGNGIRSPLARYCDRALGRIVPLSSVHMMMAICERSK
ncbi:MAG: methyltransferase domain-containing protein [Phycisphaerales bacterium]|nr:MAG: methyltransferase domain-containing protein [Phycisphaerales bacterium]